MEDKLSFESALIGEIMANLNNEYSDNHDDYRFGVLPKEKLKIKYLIKKPLVTLLIKRDYYKHLDKTFSQPAAAFKGIDRYFSGLRELFNSLANDESKHLLLKLIAFRTLGYKKVKLPLSSRDYWASVKEIEKITDFADEIPIKFMSWSLFMIDLHKINIPIKLYFSPVAVYIDFILKQYEYRTQEKTIKVKRGDYVIDAGGCFGDTALYFANEVGDGGKVYTYEFIPSNLAVLDKNLSLNPHLKPTIHVIDKPVWENSDVPMYFIDNGPGSRVFMEAVENHDGQANSLSIDDLVERQNIPRVDFIKMDIEGAEPFALKGALETIKKFRPTLAIAIYHSWDDFINIPAYILSLNLGYRLYLGHYTIHAEETIIFAEAVDL